MKLLAKLPVDREAEGLIEVLSEDGMLVYGPRRCRGEADDGKEREHGTADDDATGQFGDHPFGESRVTSIEQNKQPSRSYGPFFLRLFPLSGEAKTGWERGRRGLGIHGGDLGPDSSLRATYGCLRCDNETVAQLAKLVQVEFSLGRPVLYECRPVTP